MSSLPPTQKLIQVAQVGGPEVMQLVSQPLSPTPAAGHILVRNHAAGVNFIDTYHRSGLYPLPTPFGIGREGAGEVVAVGEGAEFKVGDRVGYIGVPSYAQYSAVPGKMAIVLPEAVDYVTGAASLLQGATALSLIRLSYHVQKGDWVLVQAAAGGVGQLLCQLCKLAGAHVIGTTSTPEKAAIAKAAGADHIILYTQVSVPEGVHRLTDGQGVHVVYDGVGKSTFMDSIASVRRLGSMITFGNSSGKVDPIDVSILQKGNIRLMRTTLFNYMTTREEFLSLVGPVLEYVAEGKLKISIHKTYPLADAAEAHKDLASRRTVGKLMLSID